LMPAISLPWLLTSRRPILPEPLHHIHGSGDTSANLQESSLQIMKSLLLNLIRQTTMPQ
jgi:hypothetical protein